MTTQPLHATNANRHVGQTRKYPYIFLDLDDTIWDFRANSKEAVRLLFHNVRPLQEHFADFEACYRRYALHNADLWRRYGLGLITKDFLIEERFLHLLCDAGIPDRTLARKMNDDYLDALAVQNRLKPFARELLNLCRDQKRPMTIVSNGFAEVQYRKLRSANIEHYFDHVVLSEQAGALKPDPAIFNYALKLNNARPDETMMIGDSFEADIVGAAHVGIRALFLNNSLRQPASPLPPEATEITSLAEAIDWLNADTDNP